MDVFSIFFDMQHKINDTKYILCLFSLKTNDKFNILLNTNQTSEGSNEDPL